MLFITLSNLFAKAGWADYDDADTIPLGPVENLFWDVIIGIGWVLITLPKLILPWLFLQGGYEYGLWAHLQIHLQISVVLLSIYFLKRKKIEGWGYLFVPFIFMVFTLSYNLIGAKHGRVSHANDFPIRNLAWQSSYNMTREELISRHGEPIAERVISRNDTTGLTHLHKKVRTHVEYDNFGYPKNVKTKPVWRWKKRDYFVMVYNEKRKYDKEWTSYFIFDLESGVSKEAITRQTPLYEGMWPYSEIEYNSPSSVVPQEILNPQFTVEKVILISPKKWRVFINPNGSGEIWYPLRKEIRSDLMQDMAIEKVKAGTFQADSLYQYFTENTLYKESKKSTEIIFLYKKRRDKVVYCNSNFFVKELFQQALEKITADSKPSKRSLKKYPVF